jgi:hypothetical protein
MEQTAVLRGVTQVWSQRSKPSSHNLVLAQCSRFSAITLALFTAKGNMK